VIIMKEAREDQTPWHGIFFKVERTLYRGRSPFQKIELVRNKAFGRVLFLDGLVQTTDADEFFYHEMLVHPALSLHRRPLDVLIIGGGDGGALREVLRHPVRKAWLCEIDGQVIEVCKRHYPWLRRDFADPRAELIVADGNAFIRSTRDRFDVILVDSSDPVGPSTVLHSRAFYAALKAILKPGGIIAAQAGSLLYHQDQHRAKYRFLKTMFRHADFYLCPVPTYPGGTWCFVYLSDDVAPLGPKRKKPAAGLRYYNPAIHEAAFALPNFLRTAIGLDPKR
jgi:spermidine synthase